MLRRFTPGWRTLVASHAVTLTMLGLYETSSAAPRATSEPFANAVEQRFEIINQLKEVNGQLREQLTLLRSGKLQVVTAEKR